LALDAWEELAGAEDPEAVALPVVEAREVEEDPTAVLPAVLAADEEVPGTVTDAEGEEGEDEVTDTEVDVVTETVPLLVAPAVELPGAAPVVEEEEPAEEFGF
jgi:hypothetical protein